MKKLKPRGGKLGDLVFVTSRMNRKPKEKPMPTLLKPTPKLRYYLFQGDCLKVLPYIKNNSIDLIITSPPYYMLKQYSGIEGEIGTKSSVEQYVRDLTRVFKHCYRVLKPNGSFYLNIDSGAREEGFPTITAWEFIPILKRIGFRLTHTIIWVNKQKRHLYKDYLLDHYYEPIFLLAKGREYTFNQNVIQFHSDVWEITHGIYDHYERKVDVPTFPKRLVEQLMLLGSNRGDWVLDPFLGIGTTMLIAQMLRRNCIGIEISSEYCRIIVERTFNQGNYYHFKRFM